MRTGIAVELTAADRARLEAIVADRNSPHWTGRAMARAAGISLSSVQRIWRAHGLTPHRIRTFKLSNDPSWGTSLTKVTCYSSEWETR